MTTKIFSMTSLALITLALSQANARTKAHPFTITDEARQTLEDIQITAAQTSTDADEFFMAVPRGMSFLVQSNRLAVLRDEVNRMGREISILNAEREALPSWQQQAIGKSLPLIKDSAANLEKAIAFLNTHDNFFNDEYISCADHIYQDSEKTEKIIKEFLQLNKLQQHEQTLQDTLAAGN